MAARGTLNHDLSKLFNQLWDADVNRMKPGKHYRISLQGKAGYVLSGSSVARDSATFPLFQFVDEEELKRRKTFQAFMSLLDNYEMSTGVAEVVTATEIAENNRFLDAILETKVMQITHEYLIQKKIVKPSLKDFKSQLYGIWFQLYSREPGRGHDSCGFEHVFVGESKRGKEITGLHNWVQFYLQEKHQNIDYKGYVARQHKNRPDEDDQVLNLQFSWKDMVKPVGGSFIGVSPEFEFAVYTVIFLMSQEKITKETEEDAETLFFCGFLFYLQFLIRPQEEGRAPCNHYSSDILTLVPWKLQDYVSHDAQLACVCFVSSSAESILPPPSSSQVIIIFILNLQIFFFGGGVTPVLCVSFLSRLCSLWPRSPTRGSVRSECNVPNGRRQVCMDVNVGFLGLCLLLILHTA
uniref:Protein endoU n=1 Tax=Leptobrachium leishanense TaxID=445787 RepID=A0A8C5M8F8_9ANUR